MKFRMIQVFSFHIDWTLTVAMVTENGRQNRLKSKKCHFELKSGGLTGKLIYRAQANTKNIFKWMINGNKIHKILKYLFGI